MESRASNSPVKLHKVTARPWVFGLLALVFGLSSDALLAQDIDGDSNTIVARRLSSPDSAHRQRAAEELARRAAVDQRKLLEGYYLVEKDRKVRLALEWALYRVGKPDLLFRVVRELNSSRHDQAVSYLQQVDTPKLLYPFLAQRENPAKVQVGLIEALAEIGDAETLEIVRPLRDSFIPGVAGAAETAIDKIEARASNVELSPSGRPRTVGATTPNSP